MRNPVTPLFLAVLALSIEAGPLINTRENPLYHGDDLTVDYTLILSATTPKFDANATFNSLLVEDSEESLVTGAATATPNARGPGIGVSETPEDQLARQEETSSGMGTKASILAGALGLGAAGIVVWRARRKESLVGLKVDAFAEFIARLWHVPAILGSREIWGGHTPFWDRVDRFLDKVEAGRDLFRKKKKA